MNEIYRIYVIIVHDILVLYQQYDSAIKASLYLIAIS